MTIVHALGAFWGFDHTACFERSRSSHTASEHVFGLRRWTRPDLQLFENGFVALLLDLFALITPAAIVRLWSLPAVVLAARSSANPRNAYLLAFVFVVSGIGSTWAWAAGVIEYVTACRTLLGVQ